MPAAGPVRNTHHFVLPIGTADVEYYLGGTAASGAPLVWPASAPALNQTVVVNASR